MVLGHGTVHAEPVARDTYAGRIVVTDLSAIGGFGLGVMVIMGSNIDGRNPAGTAVGGALVVGSLAVYTVGPPLLHMKRGNPRSAMRSALVRAGLPIVGAWSRTSPIGEQRVTGPGSVPRSAWGRR